MSDFTSNIGLLSLQTLAKQLDICGDSSDVHVACVLALNGISQNCHELTALLNKCFEEYEMGEYQEIPVLSDILSKLTKRAEEFAVLFLDKCDDHLEDLRLWTVILKTLHDSFVSHPKMWTQSTVFPKEGRDKMKRVLQERHKDDTARKLLLEVPELVGFFGPMTAEDLYLELVDKTIAYLRGRVCNKEDVQKLPELRDLNRVCNEEDVQKPSSLRDLERACIKDDIQKIVDNKPKNFKFSEEMFDKLFQIEESMLACEQVDELLQQLYTLIFFAYEHSADPDKIRQMYSDSVKCKDHQQMRHKQTALEMYNEFCGKILSGVFKKQTDRVAYLFHWLCVFDPKGSFVAHNIDHFEELSNSAAKQQPKPDLDVSFELPTPPAIMNQAREDHLSEPDENEAVQREHSEEHSPSMLDNQAKSGMHKTGFGNRAQPAVSSFATNSLSYSGFCGPDSASGSRIFNKPQRRNPLSRRGGARDTRDGARDGGRGVRSANYVAVGKKSLFTLHNFGSNQNEKGSKVVKVVQLPTVRSS